MTNVDETRRRSPRRDSGVLCGMAPAEATRMRPDKPGADLVSSETLVSVRNKGRPSRRITRLPEREKPRGSFDESPPSRGTHVPPSRTRRSYSGQTAALFRRSLPSPPSPGTPPARRLWVVTPSARRPEGPRPARSFRTQQERLRFSSCESIRTLGRKFPSNRAVLRGFPPSTNAM